MEMLKSAQIELRHQDSLIVRGTDPRSARFNLSKPGDARKFRDKYNHQKLEKRGGRLVVQVVAPETHDTPGTLAGTTWLKVLNVRRTLSEDEVRRHFTKTTGNAPQILKVFPHSTGPCSSFACVQLGSKHKMKEALSKLRNSELSGRKLWARKTYPLEWDRAMYNRGKTQMVKLFNLPIGVKVKTIEKMCSEHGTVKSVKLHMDSDGHYCRTATVKMDSPFDATRVISKLQEKEVNKCIILTGYGTQMRVSRTLEIGPFPGNVTESDVIRFVRRAVSERELVVKMIADVGPTHSEKCAHVGLHGREDLKPVVAMLRRNKLGGVAVKVNEMMKAKIQILKEAKLRPRPKRKPGKWERERIKKKLEKRRNAKKNGKGNAGGIKKASTRK